jgi:hypothetical protein
MANNKMTKVSAFTIALELVKQSNHPDKALVEEKIAKEIENLGKKNAGSGKPTAKQTANMGIGELVVQYLRENPNQVFTITELMKNVPGLPAEITNQKLTSIFRLDSVKPYFTRTMEKGKAYFQYKSAEDECEDEE